VGKIGSYAQQAWDFAQGGVQAVQAAQQFAGSLGIGGQPPSGPPPQAAPSPADAGQPAALDAGAPPAPPPFAPAPPTAAVAPALDAGALQALAAAPATTAAPPAGIDQIALLLQALQQRQIPPLPGPVVQPAPAPAPVHAQPRTDALGLLRLILTNPQLQQALQSGAPGAAAATMPRSVELPVPAPAAPRHVRSVPIPLGAVMNAIAALAGQSMTELNEYTREEESEVPEYLVDEAGDFVVDPASADDRAALVAHLFRLSDATQRSGRYPRLNRRPAPARVELDEHDQWARDAGFI